MVVMVNRGASVELQHKITGCVVAPPALLLCASAAAAASSSNNKAKHFERDHF